MESLFGGLFGFESKDNLEDFVSKIDKESALKIIELSLLYALKSGLYSFEESHIIYKCLNKIKKNENTILPDNNPDGGITN